MNWNDLLNELLALFRENIENADFLPAYPGTGGSRRAERVTVTGEVDGETVKPGSQEVRYRFRLYLPEQADAAAAEDLFAAMCSLTSRNYPGFSAVSRGAAERDKATGLLTVTCTISFLSLTGSGSSAALGRRVLLGGREYRAAGWKTSVSSQGKELISIGETVPFALLDEETEYTVELEGIDTSGLEKLACFTAVLGQGDDETVYGCCRWKSLSDVLRRAVFVSRQKQE